MSETNAIKEVRKRLGLTQQELADRLGVGIASISRWERGITKPSNMVMNRIARETGKVTAKLCPLRVAAMLSSEGGMFSDVLARCSEDDCGWWDHNRCAILTISQHISLTKANYGHS